MSKKTIRITSRGVMTRLDYSGTSIIHSFTGSQELTRDETLLWTCAQFAILSEPDLSYMYHHTASQHGFHVADIGVVFKNLLEKNLMAFGRDYDVEDAIYRMLCKGCLMADSNSGIRGKNIIPVRPEMRYGLVRAPEKTIPFELVPQVVDLARRIVADEWTFPQLVRNIDKGYPVELTQEELFDEYCNNHPEFIPTTEFLALEEQLLKTTYYKTDIGRQVAGLTALLLTTSMAVLI